MSSISSEILFQIQEEAWQRPSSKMSRVVQGTITRAKASRNLYRVRYLLNGKHEEKWYSVNDITSLSRDDEKEA